MNKGFSNASFFKAGLISNDWNNSFATFRKLKFSLLSLNQKIYHFLEWGILGEKYQLNVFIKIIHLVLIKYFKE